MVCRKAFALLLLCSTIAPSTAHCSDPSLHLPFSIFFSLSTDSLVRSYLDTEFSGERTLFEDEFKTSDHFELPSDTALTLREKIDAAFDKVTRENRFIDFLDHSTLIDFPVGLRTDFGGFQYTILLDSVVMRPRESFLYASMVFETPRGRMHFTGREIQFSKTGGLSGEGKLELVGDYPIDLGGDLQLVVKGSGERTYVEFDCNGYKRLSLEALLIFSRNIVVPASPSGKADSTRSLAVSVRTSIVEWGDLMAQVTVPAFHVNGLPDISFKVTNAWVDLSETRNPAGMKFPPNYPLGDLGRPVLWEGLYIKDVWITLPPHFAARSAGNPRQTVSFGASDLMVDHTGMCGKVYVTDLLSLEKGKLAKWNFSVDKFYLGLVSNQLTEGGLEGRIQLPINNDSLLNRRSRKPTNVFNYTAIVRQDGQYIFNVNNDDTLRFDMWKADVVLHPSSFIEISRRNDTYYPKAFLNGELSISVGLEKGQDNSQSELTVTRVAFEGLEIQSEKPNINFGFFSLGRSGANSSLGGITLSVENITGSSRASTLELALDVTLELSKAGESSFGAEGRINILSDVKESKEDVSIDFDKVEIQKFSLNIDKGVFKFRGTVAFYRSDKVYGNGLSGIIDASFHPGIKVRSAALFGIKDGLHYWYADAALTSRTGLAFVPPVTFYSFGGGAYYHMKMSDRPVSSPLGRTGSGISYIPDRDTGLGLKATTTFGIKPGVKAFNAETTFEIVFNTNGGIRSLSLDGNGYFLSAPLKLDDQALKERVARLVSNLHQHGSETAEDRTPLGKKEIFGIPEGRKAQLYANIFIQYDVDNSILHGDFSIYVNVAGGLIKGSGEERKAGEGVLHFSPSDWYIYLGRPEESKRIGLEVLNLARMDAYFVMGSIVPDTPPPPSQFESIFHDVDLSYMKDLNSLSDGSGVGFGASFNFDTGDLTFKIFYARFAALIGADVMLRDYGDTECAGSGPLGVNGWYANGQAYAFLEGKIGIKVKVMRRTRKLNILEVGAAVLAQAKLPNPTWLKGVAGGYFNILGGLVKGNCQFEVVVGKECDILERQPGSLLESIEVLSQITPADNSTEVDVFAAPQAVFNYAVDTEYEMINDIGEIVKFRIKLDDFSATSNGQKIAADLRWNDDHTVAALNPFEILPPETQITIHLSISFQEYRSGMWMAEVDDGHAVSEKHIARFKTSKAPERIPDHNVLYSYPAKDQLNFYKNEYAEGYIALKQGQAYLFNASWQHKIRFHARSGMIHEIPMTYAQAIKEIQFRIPSELTSDVIYDWSIVARPPAGFKRIDLNIDTVSADASRRDDPSIKIRTRVARGNINVLKEKVLYTAKFSTSRYSTFGEKLSSLNASPGWRDPLQEGVHAIGSNIGGVEPLSMMEIYGSGAGPLIQLKADLSNVTWFREKIFPLIYLDYPLNSVLRISGANRDPEILGIIPTKAVFLYQYPYDLRLGAEDVNSISVASRPTVGRVDYFLAWYMYHDFVDLSNQAARYVSLNGPSDRLDALLTASFPPIQKGLYPVDITYVLPGRKIISSSHKLRIFNPVD